MSLFKLIGNTLEGAVQLPVAATKYVVGVGTSVVDGGKVMDDAAQDMSDAVKKIGSSK
jgi:hypothetical protein